MYFYLKPQKPFPHIIEFDSYSFYFIACGALMPLQMVNGARRKTTTPLLQASTHPSFNLVLVCISGCVSRTQFTDTHVHNLKLKVNN